MGLKPDIQELVRNLSQAETESLKRFVKSEAFESYLDRMMSMSEEERVKVIDDGSIEQIAEQAVLDRIDSACREWLTEKGYLK